MQFSQHQQVQQISWIKGTWVLALILGLTGASWGAERGEIRSGETRSGAITNPLLPDVWTFEGVAGDRVLINVVPISGELDTEIYLYPPDGGSYEKHEYGKVLDHQLAQSGLYTIVITDESLSKSGDYNISLTKIPTTLRPGLYDPSPADKAALPIPSSCSLLSWDPVAGATGYDLYFGEDVVEPLEKIGDNFLSPLLPCPVLDTGNVYYWYVVAHTPGAILKDLIGGFK